jgi:hypothetical protein
MDISYVLAAPVVAALTGAVSLVAPGLTPSQAVLIAAGIFLPNDRRNS